MVVPERRDRGAEGDRHHGGPRSERRRSQGVARRATRPRKAAAAKWGAKAGADAKSAASDERCDEEDRQRRRQRRRSSGDEAQDGGRRPAFEEEVGSEEGRRQEGRRRRRRCCEEGRLRRSRPRERPRRRSRRERSAPSSRSTVARSTLANLDKVLYPSRIHQGGGDRLLRADRSGRDPGIWPDRCITFRRYPDGTDRDGFFEKRCNRYRPEWVPVSLGPGDRRGGIEYCRDRGHGHDGVGGEPRRPRTPRPDGVGRATSTRHAPWCSTSIRARTRRSSSAARSRSPLRGDPRAVGLEDGARPRARRVCRCTCR